MSLVLRQSGTPKPHSPSDTLLVRSLERPREGVLGPEGVAAPELMPSSDSRVELLKSWLTPSVRTSSVEMLRPNRGFSSFLVRLFFSL